MTNEDAITILKMVFCENECVNSVLNNGIDTAIYALESIDKIKAERDAAIADLKEISMCENCSHNNDDLFHSVCMYCDYRSMSNWEWRGIHDDK